MRKILLSTVALLMSVFLIAGNGSSKADAIDFDWANGNVHESTEALWYNVDLAPVDDAKYLVLYLTNLADEEATVHIDMSVQGFDATMSGVDTVIAAGKYYRFEFPKEMINTLLETYGLSAYADKIEQLSLSLQSDQKVMLAANVYTTEAEFIQKEVLTHLEEIDWNKGVKQEALSTKWYEVDITSVKNNQQHLQVSFKNYASETAVLAVSFILNNEIHTLPVPVPANFNKAVTLDYQILRLLPSKTVKVGVTTTATIEVGTSVKSALAEDKTPCLNAINPQHGKEYTHAAGTTQWYALSLDWLESQVDYSSLYLANKSNKTAHVTIGLVPNCNYTTGTAVTLPIPAGFELGVVAPNIVGRLLNELKRFEGFYGKVDAAKVYLEITSDQELGFGLDVKNPTTNPCLREDLISFDWNKGATLTPGKTEWYDVDITKVKGSGKHVKLTFTNPTNTIVWLATVVSIDCPAKLTVPMIVPVYPGASVDKVIDYSFMAAQPIDNIYVGVLAEDAIVMGAELIDATVEEPVDCVNHTEVESGVKYIHKAGTTWYKFSNKLLDNMSDAPRFTFENLSSNHVRLTAGATVACQYGILTKAKFIIPGEILNKPIHHREFAVRIPREFFQAARKLVDSDVTEFMLQLTADNPFAFSIDMQTEDACHDATAFNWNDCFDLTANQDKWFMVDLNEPLKSTEPYQFSLYNNSDEDAVLMMETSPTCPVVTSMVQAYTLSAGDSMKLTIKPEKIEEFFAKYPKFVNHNKTCYVRFNATGDVTMCVTKQIKEDEEEPTPSPCDDLDELKWKNKISLKSLTVGELYKLDLTGITAGKAIRLIVNNDLSDEKKATVVTEVYADCQDETPVSTSTNEFEAGEKRYSIAYEKLASITTEGQRAMYLKVTSIELEKDKEEPENPEDCPDGYQENVLDAEPVAVCENELPYVWDANNKSYDVAGTYYDTVTVNCTKTIRVLELSLFDKPEDVVEYDTICPGDSLYWNGEWYYEADSYPVTLTNENGCEYTATLNLYIPDPENNIDFDNLPAVSKYGNRLLVINLHAIDSMFGWVPSESDVQWFKVVGEVDKATDALDPSKGDDDPVGNGYYYTFFDGSSLADDYYALILHDMVEGDCEEILRTTILSSSVSESAPQLVPTIASPNADLRLLNLNPSAVTEIRVYNTTGDLQAVHTASEVADFMFKAASTSGYYMVEVQNDGDKVTLRYIVK